jgi:hypothetical protein
VAREGSGGGSAYGCLTFMFPARGLTADKDHFTQVLRITQALYRKIAKNASLGPNAVGV